MAQIDLKFATIKLKDGYSKTGAVNNASGYPATTLTIAVDGFTVALVAGDTFKIAGESGQPVHTVVSVVNTTGSTTSITFTTAIAAGGVADNAVITVTKPGAVNNASGYTGALTMAVDGITGIIPVGSTFLITGESASPVHTVTSQTATSGNTTSITFTTAATAADDDVITFTFAGAVNQPNGYTAATTMLVDGFTGAVANGDRFTVAGETDSPIHTISAHSETSLNTTSITFTPAATVADNAIITLLPHELEVNIGEGKLEYTEKVNREYKLNKGRLSYVRNGNEEPLEVSMDFVWVFLTAASGDVTPTIEDVLKHRGPAATWVSTDTDLCQPFAIDIEVEYTPPCVGEEKETITLEMFRHEELQHNPVDAQVSMTGKCNVTEATVSRS